MNKNIHVVIMAGGTGTRFWPYSRNNKPKQFLDVLGTGRSLLQMTYDRFKGEVPNENVWVVSNEIYKELLSEELPEIPESNILLEPSKRNTAPCVAYAAYKIRQKDPNGVMVILPSDHVIFREKAFLEVIEEAVQNANDRSLITIGIEPNRPETGYGYIQFEESEDALKKVKTFTEKPQLDLAKKFIESGEFVWNAGIFVWSVNAIVAAFEEHQPELAEVFAEGADKYFTEAEERFVKRAYSLCKNISIDYAIMEKAEEVFVVLGDIGWSDLGSWNALHEIKEKNGDDNVLEGDIITYDSKDNYILSKTNRLVLTQGLEGFLVADFEDVLLVCKKEDSGIFRTFVNDVKEKKGEELI
ncbi:mannose-1-phosphate guanylyltransferase [Marinoscillum furvescens]|uniref:mannose-1-phosphate guanylyltransferase n=1 Tax=Marinoscillum furvescens DSM 4134 TaxID=1122208 RepID=A0A3D9L3A8_MARFU|nr:mannose-1-phosphate guanylyltransferase [Marinoscillum furvescens]RED99723.1 mannose-1-phosphate guanylyltransferase (GDP) [Marinoscillum furvescens DSM 4134]